jgi:DNA-binding transcriptional ArsR family regulator
MIVNVDIAEIAALIGDPARANMLSALMGGQALTATELAYEARVTPQTASAHLAKLTQARLLAVERQGRNRYFRLAGPAVANALESLMILAGDAPPRRAARTCYDHLAGGLGVAVTDALVCRGFLVERGNEFVVTPEGLDWFGSFGIDVRALRRTRRVFARRCLDWSERRPHLAGTLGAAVAEQLFDRDWVVRIRDSRGLTITAAGRRGLRRSLGIELLGT